MSIKTKKSFFIISLALISLGSNAKVADKAIDSFFKSYPDLKHRVITKTPKDIGCSHPEVRTKLPIRASSRWVLRLVCPGGKKRNILVSVQEKQVIYYSTRAISAGSILGPMDFKKNELWTDRVISTLKSPPLGYTTKLYIKKGKKLTSASVEQFYLVKAGTKMNMHLKKGPLTITISVEAREAGNVGDKISFINLRTNRVVVGKIEDHETVIY